MRLVQDLTNLYLSTVIKYGPPRCTADLTSMVANSQELYQNHLVAF